MISAKQIKAARVFLDWDQRELAKQSGLSLPTIQRMERDDIGPGRSSAENVDKLTKALIAAGIEILNDGAPGVRLRTEIKAGG